MEKNIKDGYAVSCENRENFTKAVAGLESLTEWVSEIAPSSCKVIPAADAAGMDEELLEECVATTGIALSAGEKTYALSASAWPTLCARAQISGTALAKMRAEKKAGTLSWAFEVAGSKKMMMLVRGGEKIAAMHSGTYRPMPFSKLMEIAEAQITSKFGSMQFISGYLSGEYAAATYELTEMQETVEEGYAKAMEYAACDAHAADRLMPCVRIATSDTAVSAATITPLFRSGERLIYMGGRASVKHETAKPLEKFSEKAELLLVHFEDAEKAIRRLAEVTIHNPTNTIVGIFNHLAKVGCTVPRSLAEYARLECERLEADYEYVSAYDIYMCMYEAIAAAENKSENTQRIFDLQENIASALKLDFSKFDVGGEVVWGDKSVY